MSTLQNQLATTEREETARAIRLLLCHPLLRRETDPEGFELVRRRHVAVTAWFDAFLGWEVELHPRAGYVRLSKVAPPRLLREDVRPARHPHSGVPFDRRRYVLFCVIAAELVRRRNVSLGELAEATVHACALDDHLSPFDTSRHGHRRAFVDAVLLLEQLGALVNVEGRTESFADDAHTSVLYRVEPTALFSLLAAPVGASRVGADLGLDSAGSDSLDDAIEALLEEPRYGPDYRAGSPGELSQADTVRRNLWLRHSALRAVFDDPVLYRSRLTPAQRGYLDSISGREQLRKAAETAGFQLETRAEGFLLVDPERIATDELFPGDGAATVAALRVLVHLTGDDDGDPGAGDLDRVRSVISQLLTENRGWARVYQDEDGASRLCTEALALLGRHHLVERDGDRVRACPAAHRYRDAVLQSASRAREEAR